MTAVEPQFAAGGSKFHQPALTQPMQPGRPVGPLLEGRLMTRFTRILVPTDFSATADMALTQARDLAEAFGASLHLVHVFEDPYTAAAYAPEVFATISPEYRDAALADAARQLDERLDAAGRKELGGTTDLVIGPPAREIVRFATDHGIVLILTVPFSIVMALHLDLLGPVYSPRTLANISGATMLASDSMMYLGVSSDSLPQVIFSFGTAPE